MNFTILLNLVVSFMLAYFAIPSVVRVSNTKHLFDVPDHRKLNKVVVPTLGGIAIFIGFTLSTLIFTEGRADFNYRYLFAALIMMFFIGIKDDIMVLSAKRKLIVQILATLLLVLPGGYQLTDFYGVFGIHQVPQWLGVSVSFLFILFIMNAINLMDGIDGLAAGVSIVIAFTLGGWFYFTGHPDYGTACFALMGALLAFLRFNLWGGHNKVFMGDTGSLLLGTFLSAMAIKFILLNQTVTGDFHITYAPVFIIGLFIVPITDTTRVFFIRISEKRSPFSPDMNHLHHLLIKSGLSHVQASSFLIAYTVLFGLLALSIQKYLPISLAFVLLPAASFLCVGAIIRYKKRIDVRREKDNAESSSKTIKIQFGPVKTDTPTAETKKIHK
ncbi:MAG: glycosyltransferase family 4 protein [Mangrovibacterium sp.]